jgi:hypothetical protein
VRRGRFIRRSPSAADNLLTNGSFQSGDFTGWTLTGNTTFTGVTNELQFFGYSSEDADGYYAYLGALHADAGIGQTVGDVAGQMYDINFWYNAADALGILNHISVTWDGTVLLDSALVRTNGWRLYSFGVTGTGSDTLQFGA